MEARTIYRCFQKCGFRNSGYLCDKPNGRCTHFSPPLSPEELFNEAVKTKFFSESRDISKKNNEEICDADAEVAFHVPSSRHAAEAIELLQRYSPCHGDVGLIGGAIDLTW